MEKETAAHSSVLAWRIPGTGEPGGCRLWGRTESDTTEETQQRQRLYIYPGVGLLHLMVSWETEVDIHTLLYVKQITNKD